MDVFEWEDSFTVGVRKIDEHNHHLFSLLNNLYKGLIEQSGIQTTRVEFIELSDYIVFHFACEEIWMVQTDYDLITGHKKQHKQLILMIMDIHEHFQNGDTLIGSMLPSLMQLLIAHIQEYDSTYGHFVQDKLSAKLLAKTPIQTTSKPQQTNRFVLES